MRTAAREKVILVAALARGSAVLKAALNGDQRARLRMLLDPFALGVSGNPESMRSPAEPDGTEKPGFCLPNLCQVAVSKSDY